MQSLNEETGRQTQLQEGLTNSFLKGNLAARAISTTYLALRDSLKYAAGEAVQFEANLKKIEVITDTGKASMASLESTIRNLALATNQSQVEIAKTALEMGKMGFSGDALEKALGGVVKLARALDEDLVKTGETVVTVLNAYGLGADQANKVTDQLAFTVKASALDIETFGTAFSYVGGTAKAAGVSLTELQGAMDVLSNAGIKASTIGTSLRRIIADLADPSSKASRAIGGQTIETLGLSGALEELKKKNIDIAGLTEIFGRTASSTSSILIRYAGVVKDMAAETEKTSGLNDQMSQGMNTTLLSSLQGIKTAWAELGITISESTGFLKTFTDAAKDALTGITDMLHQSSQLKAFKEKDPQAYAHVLLANSSLTDFRTSDRKVAESPEFSKFLAQQAQAQADAKRKENTVGELSNLFDKNFKLPSNFDPDKQLDLIQVPDENKPMFHYIEKLWGTDKQGFEAALKKAKEQFALKAEIANTTKFDNSSLKKKRKEADFDPLDVFDRLEDLQTNGDTYAEAFMKRQEKKDTKDDKRINRENDEFFKKIVEGRKHLAELRAEVTQNSASFLYMQEALNGLNGSVSIFSSYLTEGIFSSKENPWKHISDAFGDFAKKMIADLIALTAKLLIFRAVLAFATGGSSGFAGGFNFTSFGGSGFLDGLLGGLGGKLQKNAAGTDETVRGPKLFLAGESGKERVRIGSSARSGDSNGPTFIIQGDVYDYDKFMHKVKMAQDGNRKAYV